MKKILFLISVLFHSYLYATICQNKLTVADQLNCYETETRSAEQTLNTLRNQIQERQNYLNGLSDYAKKSILRNKIITQQRLDEQKNAHEIIAKIRTDVSNKVNEINSTLQEFSARYATQFNISTDAGMPSENDIPKNYTLDNVYQIQNQSNQKYLNFRSQIIQDMSVLEGFQDDCKDLQVRITYFKKYDNPTWDPIDVHVLENFESTLSDSIKNLIQLESTLNKRNKMTEEKHTVVANLIQEMITKVKADDLAKNQNPVSKEITISNFNNTFLATANLIDTHWNQNKIYGKYHLILTSNQWEDRNKLLGMYQFCHSLSDEEYKNHANVCGYMENFKSKIFDFPNYVKKSIETNLMYLKIFSPNKEKVQRISDTLEYLFHDGQIFYASKMFDYMLSQDGI